MQIIKINMVPSGVSPMAFASQYDDERLIRFVLYSGEDEYILNAYETVHAEITKPDGTLVSIPMTNDRTAISDLVLTSEDCDQAGICSGEVVITDTHGHVTGSLNFILKIEEDAYGTDVTTDTATGNPCTFNTDLADNLVSLTAEIVASGGGGTPSTPIPINGYTEANITRCGVNLFDKNAFVNTYSSNFSIESDGSIYSSNYSSVLNNTIWENVTGKSGSFTITFISKYSTSGGSVGLRPNVIYTDGTSETIQPTNTQTYLTTTFTTSASKTVDKIVVDYGSSTYPTYFYLQVEVGSTANAYQDYNGQTYTIAVGQTVYGGVLHIENGRTWLEVTWGSSVDLGSLDWLESGGNFFCQNAVSNRKTNAYAICEGYTQVAETTPSGLTVDRTFAFQENVITRVSFRDTRYTTTEDFKTAMSGKYLAYELATPIDIDLTPVQISALVGTNNITSDLGGDVEVTYIKKV